MSGPAVGIIKVKRKLHLSKCSFLEKVVNVEEKVSVSEAFKMIGSEASPPILTPHS